MYMQQACILNQSLDTSAGCQKLQDSQQQAFLEVKIAPADPKQVQGP